MRKLGSLIAIVIMLVPLLAAPANAQVVSISQEIHIRGIVPPMRFIVVDGQGNVTEVTSNTPENVTPVVRLGSIPHGSTLPLTPGLLHEYQQKTKGHDMHSLDLHFAPPAQPVAARQAAPLFSQLMHLSLLRLPLSL